MYHLGVAAIKHHVGMADGGKVTGLIDQQQRYRRTAIEKEMNQAPCGVTALCVDEHPADKGCVYILGEVHRLLDIANGGNIVGTESQRVGDHLQQFPISAVKQDRFLWSHSVISPQMPGLRERS